MVQKFLILFIFCLILYFPSLNAPFTFDDQAILVYNPALQNLSQGTQGIVDVWNFQHSRFLTNFTIAINFYFHGLNVFGYHVVNVLIHFITTIGVWFLTRLIIDLKEEKKLKIDMPLWAAVLFLVHPLHTESVSYLNQRSSALVSLFYLWSVVFYIQARLSSLRKQKFFNFSLAIGLGFVAILCKETAMTLPLAWILIDALIIGRLSPRWVWVMVVIMVGAVGMFFEFNWKTILFNPVYSQSHGHEFLTLGTYLLTQLQVLVVFIKLIFIPLGLNLDYDFAMAHSLFEPVTLFSLIFLLTLFYVGYILRNTHWYITFGIFWFFISLLTHILPPRANVIAEHKLYLTLTLLIPVLVFGSNKMFSGKVFKFAMIATTIIFFLLTFYRNLLWADPVLLWKDTVSKSPYKARAHLNLGYSYAKKGQYEEALGSFFQAIKLEPFVPEAYINSSQMYANKNNLDEALVYANKALEVAPQSPLPYIQRGIIYARQKKDNEALNDFSAAINLNAKDLEVFKMRGLIYARLNRSQEALNDFKIWLERHPQDINVLSQRADLFFRTKKYQLALQDYDQLISLAKFAPYYYNRSVLYEILGDRERMQADRQIAKYLGFPK